MRCLITKYDIEVYKQELIDTTNSKEDVTQALNTIAYNMHRITKADARMMLNILVRRNPKCVA
jgi:hypothetical protein